jgi:hypothetical protein
MAKIITAKFLTWKLMELDTDTRIKRAKMRPIVNSCPQCRDRKHVYNPKEDAYSVCRRCVKEETKDYNWFDL